MIVLDARALGVEGVARAVDRPPSEIPADVVRSVESIVGAVRARGDEALIEYTARFDRFHASCAEALAITPAELAAAERDIDPAVRAALAYAAERIERYHAAALPKAWRITDEHGSVLGQEVRPLDRVGIYIPGGRAAYPSTVLMTAVPARVAGVREIIVACPQPESIVMAAAATAGATRLFRLGGAHAIAALAFGTASIPKVDRIVGPGNKYVALAKSYVSAEVGIDMQAGPSEILILSSRGRPAWLAADLIAQAEHDTDARAVLITWNRRLAERVARDVIEQLPADGPATTSLASHGGIIVAGSRNEAIALANRMAPEHLVVDDESTARAVGHAGAIFIGEYTAQVAGDYAIGSNHVLPTGGAARLRGGLSAADFVRVVSVQRVTSAGLSRLAPTVRTLALAEGLTAHAQSIAVRGK
jgi:histidinol dehydrogenase